MRRRGLYLIVVQATGEVRFWAADGLGQFGDQARPAVPAWLELLNDSDWSIKQVATNTLQRIDLQALENATDP